MAENYSDAFEIPIGSDSHKKIMAAFRERKQLGKSGQQLRLEAWAKNEDVTKAYIPTSENDKLRKDSRRMQGAQEYTTIQVPYSYAMMLTLHTYLVNTFMSRTPILQVEGRHGEAQTAETAMESLLAYQISYGANIPALYVWLLDPLRYGCGIIGQYWEEEFVPITTRRPVVREFMGAPLPGTQKMETIQELVAGYQGTCLFNVRPQDFQSDPRVPLWRFQEGEFCIRFDTISWTKGKEREDAGIYFNMKEARKAYKEILDRDLGSSRTVLPDNAWINLSAVRDPEGNPLMLNIHEFYWEVVPKSIPGLGNGANAEKWVFTIANDSVVIGAQPLGLLHNKFPFDVLEYEIGGYELFNRSVLEVAEPLNDTLTWLFNSHFFNVRKALNDQFVVNPSKVEIADLEDPNPGRMIKLKPAAYDEDVRTVITQLQTVDVTRAHMQDTTMVADLLQRLLGSSDTVQGVTANSRTTATESRMAAGSAMNRIKTVSEWMSHTGWSPMAQKMIQSTQQLYDLERKFRIVGNLAEWGERFMMVTPDSIAGFFDFVPVDGTMSIDRFAQANLWKELMAGMAANPTLMMTYDIPKIFAFVAQLSGLKNISSFRVQVVPDAQLMAQAQAGNVVPMKGSIPAVPNMNEPAQIPGLGATG